jgi:hypothetical protein
MKERSMKIFTALVGSALLGAFSASYAKLPAPTPEEKAAAAARAEKDTAAKAKAAKELGEAQDKAASSYRKNQAPATSRSPGADHAKSRPPDADLTRREAQNQMPKPGQANDHSTTARDPQNSSRR